MGKLAETVIYIDDSPILRSATLRSKARRLHARYGLDLIIVDYLQLIQSSSPYDNRVQEVGEISRSLKMLARELDVPVLACSQLFHSFNCRNMRQSLFKIGVFTNKKLILATLVSFLLLMAAVYMPLLQKVFKTESLGLVDWFLVIAISSLPLWAMEMVKKIKKEEK
jgi:magnesium-transporting ATPase (P-type)